MTLWFDTISGERLDREALAAVQERARRTYDANPHIFEDALDALTAVGVVALHRGGVRRGRVAARLCGHERPRSAGGWAAPPSQPPCSSRPPRARRIVTP